MLAKYCEIELNGVEVNKMYVTKRRYIKYPQKVVERATKPLKVYEFIGDDFDFKIKVYKQQVRESIGFVVTEELPLLDMTLVTLLTYIKFKYLIPSYTWRKGTYLIPEVDSSLI